MKRRQLVVALGSAWTGVFAQGREPLIAVAASMQRAMEEIAQPWLRSTGHRVSFVYGASGNFVRQIQQGLPVELFLSADEDFALKLADAGLTRDKGVIYGSGRLALIVAKGSLIPLDPELKGLK